MTSKDKVSRSYLERQRLAHAGKLLRPDKSRHAIVFGAEKHNSIGADIALTLSDRGFTVLTPTKEQLDIRDQVELKKYFGSNSADTLICCQGETWLDWIEDQPLYKIKEVVEVTLTGSIYAASLFAQTTMDDPWRKQIVFIGSMAYNRVLNGSAPYCAAKAGLAHFTRCIAWELAPKGFDVFSVHPSNTEGAPMTEATIEGIMRYRGLSRAEAEDYWGASLPRNRWLRPEDISQVVSMLLTDIAGGYQSGTNIELGGGQR